MEPGIGANYRIRKLTCTIVYFLICIVILVGLLTWFRVVTLISGDCIFVRSGGRIFKIFFFTRSGTPVTFFAYGTFIFSKLGSCFAKLLKWYNSYFIFCSGYLLFLKWFHFIGNLYSGERIGSQDMWVIF